tara:strand:- start:1903 stop:2904 length:1002 start_codon:yes stop_codon:yes gene_type:complete
MVANSNSNRDSIFGLFLTLCLIGLSIFFTSIKEVDKTIFVIEKGMSLNAVTDLLHDKDIIHNKSFFKYRVYFLGLSNKIPFGTFLVEGKVSNRDIINTIFEEGPIRIKLTIPEGSSSNQIFLKANMLLDRSDDYSLLFNNQSFIEEFGIQASSLEGYLFPDTYYFFKETNSREVLDIMISEFWKNFNKKLIERTNELGFTVHEVVTLASIIEGEALLDEERVIISSVYHNRLNKRMKLQADPTIQYIIPGNPKALSNRDLKRVSPYNTYLNYGLPPGPINNPGLESIKAALYPADTDYLYFVAQGDGSHAFTTNQKDHLKAKALYKKYKRENR